MAELATAVPHAWLAAWVAVVGATVGSFLNVVIARLPAGESVVHPRSRCPRCRAAIAWYDNLPIASWLLLRGRCRGCAEPISVRYPIVEAAGAALALAALERRGFGLAGLLEFAFTAILLSLAAIDLDTWLLPNALTWPLIALGLAAGGLGLGGAPSWREAALGAALGFGAFWTLGTVAERVLRKEALGFGDVWLLSGLGAWLGARALLPVVLLASFQGAVAGVLLILTGRSQPGPPEEAPGGAEEAASAAVGPPSGAVAADEGPPGPPTEGPAEAPPPDAAPASPAEVPAETPAGPTAAAPPQVPGAEDDWVPPRHAVPFGPFLVAGALEWLWFSGALARAVPALSLFR